MTTKTYIPAIAGIIILATTFIITSSQRPPSRADDEKAIRAHIEEIIHAYMRKDSVAVRATHSKNWRGFLSRTTTILRGIDDYMNEAKGSFDLTQTWRIVNYKMLDYDIVFNGETGIVCYIAEFFWEQGNDKGSYKLRSIDIYGKENGHWNQIASNIGPLPDGN